MRAHDIPTAITRLTYDAPGPVMSQHTVADVLAHYWPAIERHVREQVAEEQRAFHAEQNRSIPCAGPGCLVHEVINHIDPAIARLANVTTSKEK